MEKRNDSWRCEDDDAAGHIKVLHRSAYPGEDQVVDGERFIVIIAW